METTRKVACLSVYQCRVQHGEGGWFATYSAPHGPEPNFPGGSVQNWLPIWLWVMTAVPLPQFTSHGSSLSVPKCSKAVPWRRHVFIFQDEQHLTAPPLRDNESTEQNRTKRSLFFTVFESRISPLRENRIS